MRLASCLASSYSQKNHSAEDPFLQGWACDRVIKAKQDLKRPPRDSAPNLVSSIGRRQGSLRDIGSQVIYHVLHAFPVLWHSSIGSGLPAPRLALVGLRGQQHVPAHLLLVVEEARHVDLPAESRFVWASKADSIWQLSGQCQACEQNSAGARSHCLTWSALPKPKALWGWRASTASFQ